MARVAFRHEDFVTLGAGEGVFVLGTHCIELFAPAGGYDEGSVSARCAGTREGSESRFAVFGGEGPIFAEAAPAVLKLVAGFFKALDAFVKWDRMGDFFANFAGAFEHEAKVDIGPDAACDFLEDDIESGYVRVLHEMLAAGWSDQRVARAVRELQMRWFELLTSVAKEAAVPFGPFSPEEVVALVAAAFLGGEEMILTGFEEQIAPVKSALRKIGLLIRAAEGQYEEKTA